MKKYGMIFASVIFTLLIMLIPNQEVRADDCIINLDYNLFSSNPNLDKIEQIDSFLKSYNDEILYFIDASFTDFRVVVSPKSAGATSYASVGSNTFSALYLLNGKIGAVVSGSFNNFDTLFNNLKNIVINQSYSTLNSNYGPSTTVSNYAVTTSGNILYSTNYDNHYLKQSTICKLSIDDTIINFNEVVPTYYDYLKSQNNEFNELIPTSQYGGIIFTFNTTNYENYLDNNSLLFNYNFYASDINHNLLDYSFEVPYFGYNGKNVYSDGSETYSYHTDRLGYDLKNKYEYSYYKSMKYFVSELKLFVYFDTLDDIYVSAYLDSLIPFEVEYLPKDSNSDYYRSVDITGKYGVMLKPNQTINDYVSMIYFKEGGKYSLQLRDNYSSTNDEFNIIDYYQIGFCNTLDVVGLVPIHCTNSYSLSIDNYFSNEKQFVYIRNENYYKSDITSIVYYDSRYYTAYIQNTSSSSIDIINPETGETEIFGPMVDFDDIYYEKMNDVFFNFFVNSFNEFKNVISEIFGNINYFFERLDIQLQYFYIVVFSLIIFIFLIRFLL